MTHGHDYYRVLGVSQDASASEVRRAYRRLARQQHPDRNPRPDAAERFRTLADAYAVLNDPARRARYDHTIRPSPRPPRPVTPPVFTRRGVVELSTHEATIVATMPLALATADGMTIVLPAGLAEGDRIRIALPEGQAVLAVSVSDERLDTT